MVDLAIYRNPVDTSGMDAKQRFRLRRKLQAALLRLMEIEAMMTAEGVCCNPENANTLEVLLQGLLRLRQGPHSVAFDDPYVIMDKAFPALREAKKRRMLETARRKIRSRRRRS